MSQQERAVPGLRCKAFSDLLCSAGAPCGSGALKPSRRHPRQAQPRRPPPPPRARAHPPPEPPRSCAARPRCRHRGRALRQQGRQQRRGPGRWVPRPGKPDKPMAGGPWAQTGMRSGPNCHEPGLQNPQRRAADATLAGAGTPVRPASVDHPRPPGPAPPPTHLPVCSIFIASTTTSGAPSSTAAHCPTNTCTRTAARDGMAACYVTLAGRGGAHGRPGQHGQHGWQATQRGKAHTREPRAA